MTNPDQISATPKVSVILPCYNVAEFIPAAIASLKSQDFDDFEVLVVDDGSTDATAAATRQAIGDDTRFRVLSQSNQGLSAARNAGLNMARGEYVAFLDGDDWLAPNFLSRMSASLDSSGADWAACAIWLEFGGDQRFGHSTIHGAPQIEGHARDYDLDDARMVARLFPSAWNKLYRRKFIGSLRFIPGALYEDHPFYWALACRSDRIHMLPEPLYHHRRGRSDQITAQGDERIFQQFERLQEVSALLANAPKRHKRTALSRLATRLVHERLEPVADTELRQAFIAAAHDQFAAQGLVWDWDGTPDIDLALATEITPALRVSVLVQGGSGAGPTHDALAAQRLPPTRILDVPSGPAPGVLRQYAARMDTGFCAILRDGDIPTPDWSARMLQALQESSGAALALCTTRHERADSIDHGLAQPDVPCAEPAALMLRAGTLLPSVDAGPEWVAVLRLSAHNPKGVALVAPLSLALGPRAQDRPRATLRYLRALITEGALTGSQASAVLAHRAQLAVLARTGRLARLAEALLWGVSRRISGLPKPPVAAHIGARLYRLL